MAHTIFGIAVFTSGQASRAFSHCGIFGRKMNVKFAWGLMLGDEGAESVHKAERVTRVTSA